MSQLEPVTLTYKGKDYTVEKDGNIWGLIEAIEDVVTFFELAPAVAGGKFPTARIFRAYAAALNYAGAKVTPNEVREAADYKELGRLAGGLLEILTLAQPGEDVDLQQGEPGNGQAKEGKPRKSRGA